MNEKNLFKINPIEKLILRRRREIVIAAGVLCITASFLSFSLEIAFVPVVFLLLLFSLIFSLNFTVVSKINQATKYYTHELDLAKSLESINMLMEIIPLKEKIYHALLCNNRIACLIAMGETETAEKEVRLFWQTFNPLKMPPNILLSLHYNMAIIKLRKRDFTGFNEQLKAACIYRDKLIRKRKKYHPEDTIEYLTLIAATYGEYDPELEGKLLTTLSFINGEPRKKPVPPSKYLGVYYRLFEMFKGNNLPEKATHYANLVINIGNEQFLSYRNAKEYLSNANGSN